MSSVPTAIAATTEIIKRTPQDAGVSSVPDGKIALLYRAYLRSPYLTVPMLADFRAREQRRRFCRASRERVFV